MAAPESEITHTVTAGEAEAGGRLDRVLAGLVSNLSRTRIKALIVEGRVSADGETIMDPSYRVKPGQTFAIIVPESRPAAPEPQPIDLDIVFEDKDVLVIDKPAGLVVHPAPGNPDRTLVNALIAHCGETLSGIGGVRRPGIVHRLDKDTSGLMVVAKNDAAHASLAAQFAGRSITRAYRAVVWGVPSPRRGEIAGNIARSPRNRKKMAVVRRGGKTALTRYRVLKPLGSAASLIECRLATGRTHQIRVHLAWKGHPIVGDPTYSRNRGARARSLGPGAARAVAALGRQALHAHLIGFTHPATAERLEFESALPPDINELQKELEGV
ncbi:MAG: RluA family pseudouridine synthase [Alphaproteobacteria bacterium]|nr:RluA family pseudouridine synthase [Alphaproteobacteria bacterium]